MVFLRRLWLGHQQPMLVAARLIQGLVSGPMMSVAQAILLRNYPSERPRHGIALWSMVIMIAPIFGPILGGWITGQSVSALAVLHQPAVGAFSAIASWSILRNARSKIVKLPIDSIGLALL